MVSRHDHQRYQDHPLIGSFLHRRQHRVQRRLCFHRADVVIFMPRLGQLILQGFIDRIGRCLCAMSHKADGGFAIVVFRCGLGNGLFHRLEVRL